MNRVLVCPVAFNEKEKVENVINRFLDSRAYGRVEYLVVDDASTDGTTKIIESYAEQGVKTIKHKVQSGVGAAIKSAIQYSIDNEYDVLVIMAGNDKDDPNEIPVLIDPILDEDFEFVQGSRYLKKNQHFGAMPFYRKIATRLHPILMSVITGKKVTDSTNGFRAIKVSMLQDSRVNWKQSWLDAYELEPYLLYKAIKLGFKFKEAPVTKKYPPKNVGYTKMKPIVGWWSILKPLIYLGIGLKK